jgi:hypothetical protein
MSQPDRRRAACVAFIEGVSIRKGRTRLVPFGHEAWFQCAYLAIQRSLPQGPPPASHARLQLALFDQVHTLQGQPPGAEPFDAWAAGAIRALAEGYGLSVGQAQHLLGLLLKYYYCYHCAGYDPQWNAEHRFIALHGPWLHVPLDSHTLLHLGITYACPEIYVNPTRTGAALRVGAALVGWSRLDDLDTYAAVQRFIRASMDNHLQGFASALDFALAMLAGPPP